MAAAAAETIAPSEFLEAPIGKVVIGRLSEKYGMYPVTIGRNKPKHFYVRLTEAPELVNALVALVTGPMSDAQRDEYLAMVAAAAKPVRAPRKARAAKPAAVAS